MDFNRKTYYQDSDIKVYLEEINDHIFIHVGINRMSKSVLKRIREKWAEVVIKVYFLGYEELFAYTEDNRIIKLIGDADLIAKYKGYEVWKWDLS